MGNLFNRSDDETMKVFIHFQADVSVGCNPYTYVMYAPRVTNQDDSPQYREEVRGKIKALYDELDGEFTCDVYFDDEKF